MDAEMDSPSTEPPRANLSTTRVELRPITPGDYEQLRLLELGEELGPLWRYRGATPSPEAWAQTVSSGVLAQFLVVNRAKRSPIGVSTCYNADFQNQFAYLAAAKFDRSDRSRYLLEGTVLFIQYVFDCWNFRKLYLEVNGFNLPQIESGIGRLLKEEGRLRDHVFYRDRYWDQHLLALYRSDWVEAGFGKMMAERGRR